LTSDHVWIGYIAQSPGPATEFKDGRTYTNQGPDMTYSCGGQLFYCDFFGNIRSTGSNKSETVDQYKSRLSDENLTKYPNAYASDANKLLFLNSRTPLLTMNGDGTFHELSPDILNPQPLGIPTEFLSTEEIKVTLQSLDEPSAMPMTEAYLNGLADGVGSVGDMIVHPINTINDVGNAIIHYDDTYNAFNNLINDYAAAIRNGDGQKVAYQTGNFLGMLAGGEAAGGAASRLGQAGKAAWLGRANGLSQEMINLTESNITSNGKTVLGHWPEYIDKAKGMNASYFDLGNAWEPNTGPLANKYFLDVISNRGDQIFLSVPKFQIRAGSQLVDEINYLTGEKGYIWINQWSLIKK